MNMKPFRPFATLVLITIFGTVTAFTFVPDLVGAQTDGVIHGGVVNQTTGQSASGVEVTLSAFTNEGLIGEYQTTTDDGGMFTFEGIDTTDGIVYAASTSYRGVLYSSGMIRFQGTTEQTTQLRIYEPTTDRSVVAVRSRGIVLSEVSPDEGRVAILDIYTLAVEGNQTFVAGDNGRSLEFPVPRNADSVTPMPGFDFGTPAIENSVVYASSALRPNGGTAQLSYVVRYTDSGFSIEARTAYPTEVFRILVPVDLAGSSDEISVTANGFEDEGLASIGERAYHVWGATSLEAGSSARISFGSLPRSGFEPNRLRVLEPALIAGAALIAAVGVTVLFWRRGRMMPELLAPLAAPAASVIESRVELVMQLQELQDEHENGLIDDELYLSERRNLLERLRLASRQIRDETVHDPN